jgi:2-polyprenyl-3-methyl-5-hydroxy-6-metoxy-1,4-benzoquinol methylase
MRMNEQLAMPTCPVCLHAPTRAAWQYGAYRIFECPHCAAQFVHPMQAACVDYYQARYANVGSDLLSGQIHPGFKNTAEKIKAIVARYLTADQRRVIDIGCGPGYYLSQLKPLGFDELGIDFNPDMVRFAKEKMGVNAMVGRIEDVINMSARFDLALLTHVLEHVEDPPGLLHSIRQLLKPHGILFVEVPNRRRFTLRRSLEKGQFIDGEYPPHHLTFWSKQSLSNALRRAEYEVLECQPEPFAGEGQVELFLAHRLKTPPGAMLSFISNSMRRIGHALQLGGDTLRAVARRPE